MGKFLNNRLRQAQADSFLAFVGVLHQQLQHPKLGLLLVGFAIPTKEKL